MGGTLLPALVIVIATHFRLFRVNSEAGGAGIASPGGQGGSAPIGRLARV